MSSPVNISKEVKLISGDSLSKGQIRSWFECLKEKLPKGVLSTVQTIDDKGNRKSVQLVHREVNDKHEYIVPVSRDLLDKEVEPAIKCFMRANSDLNFEIETSTAQIGMMRSSSEIKVEDGKFVELCKKWAKHKHDAWMKDRLDNGWRYGETVNFKNKTHPLLKQWSDLSDKFKKIDPTEPQDLLNLLDDAGYAVIAKAELEGMLNLLRGR